MKLLLILIILLSGCSIYFEPEFNQSNDARIFDVIDGDTAVLSNGDLVRVIGIDAPEKKEPGYEEATEFLRNLTKGKNVILESEGDDRDQYGRLLRHIYVDNKSVAIKLLENNLATIYPYYNGTYLEEFKSS